MEKQEPRVLKRSIGLWSAVAINIGAIIGGGIFIVTGVVAGYAGSYLVVSIVIAGAIASVTAFSFAKLTAWQPVEGGAYEYGRQLISPYAGFLAGWMWLVANTFIGAAVSIGFAYHITAVFPSLPTNLVAAFMCLGFTGLNLIGVRESTSVNNVLVSIKLVVLAFFVAFGAIYVNTGNFIPLLPSYSGIFYGTFFIFFAYGGFARISVVAEEVKDAQRNVPRALLFSLGISLVIYFLVGYVAVGLIGADGLSGSDTPLRTAIDATGSALAVQIVSVGGLVATASVLLTAILGVSRMAFSMARHNDLPLALARLHNKFLTPYYAIIATGALMALLVLFVDLTRVVVVSTFALLFTYCITNIAAFKLKTNCWYHKIMPLVGLSTCLTLLAFIFFASPETAQAWGLGLLFLFVGSLIYLIRKKWNKKPEKTK